MTIYWSFIVWVLFWGLILVSGTKRITIIGELNQFRAYGDLKQNRTPLFIAVLIFGYMVFFIGLRSDVGDTYAYMMGFNNLSVSQNIFGSFGNSLLKGWGFNFLEFLIKKYVSTDYHVLLMIIAIFSCICMAKTLFVYSRYFVFSTFIFIADGDFTWMLNGIRQFIAAMIIFVSFGLLLKNKTISYILIILLACTFHFTAIIMLPVYFIVRTKPWSKKIFIFILITLISCIFISKFNSILSTTLDGTSYGSDAGQLSSSKGTNPLRVLVGAIPVILAFWKRKKIQGLASPMINICINLSVIGVCINAIGIFTSGILIGRLPIYVSLYSLIILPWIIQNCFTQKQKSLIMISCFIGYLGYFYYQMMIAWGGLPYISDVLNLYI